MSHKLVVSCVLTILCLSLIPTSFLVNPVAGSTGLYVVAYNPYAGVDWDTTFRLKTQLHAHTILGGGGSQPYQVINNYAAAGFDALGISDYNRLTWPWSLWDEYLSPAAKSMVPIPNEQVSLSNAHINAPFLTTAVNGTLYGTDVQGAMNAIIAVGGIPLITSPADMGFSLTTADSWTGFQGTEIYNHMDGYALNPFDFQFWDHLLTDPARAQKHIWGFAVDDSHDGDINSGWIVVFASQKNAASVKSSIIAGSFVAVVNYTNPINSITQTGNTLTVGTSSSVVWKADGEQIVGTSSNLDIDTLGPGYTYVRAEVNGTAFTQPIFITQTSPYTIFSNGFEDGFASWTNTVFNVGFIGQSLDTANSGSYSAKISLIHYYGDKAYANKSLGASFKRINIRAYVNFSSDSTTGIMMGPLTLSSSNGYVAAVVRNFGTSQWGIRTRNPTSGIETYFLGSANAITLKKWYYIELEAVMSVHGFATLWIDGEMKVNATNVNFGANTVTSVDVGEYNTIGDLSTNLKYYIDDVVVSDSYIGPIRLQYGLTVGVSSHGTTNATGTSVHDANTNVAVLATADTGYHLGYWLRNGTNVGSVNPYTINMTANYNLTAVFAPNQYSLTVSTVGSGSVTRNNTGPYFYGDHVQLTANPSLGWTFSSWSGDLTGSLNPSVITMDGNKVVTANFVQLGYVLTVAVSPIEGGSVSRNNTGPYHYGDWVRLTAVANSGWSFSQWSGHASGTNRQVDIFIDGDKSVTAVFIEAIVPLSGWQVAYNNTPYVLNSSPASLYLQLNATDTGSKVNIFSSDAPKLILSNFVYVNVTASGTDNARLVLRFFLDDGSSFDVVYWQEPASLDAVSFDLSPYAGRKLSGTVYLGLMSSDGTTANITITQMAFLNQPLPPTVPLSGWNLDAGLTNAPYVLASTVSTLFLQLNATDTGSKVVISSLNVPKLNLSNFVYVDVTASGTENARITLRFFLDDGSSFDVVYWQEPASLSAVSFDLSPYAGRKLNGLVYLGLMSSDGATANLTVTQLAFVNESLPPMVPLSGWNLDAGLTNAPYVLASTVSTLFLQLNATDTGSKVVISSLNVPKLNLTNFSYVNVTVSGTNNARLALRFFLDNGNSIDVVYWQDAATLNALTFDLSPYAGRKLSGSVYLGLVSSDGTTANITITDILFSTQALPPFVPLSAWSVETGYTNAPYTLTSSESSLFLQLDAVNVNSKVTISTVAAPNLNLTNFSYVDVTVSGTSNARLVLRFFMDNGGSFDVVYWADPATLNATSFSLGPYTGRKLSGLVYIGLMSSDGTTANFTITEIAFVTA